MIASAAVVVSEAAASQGIVDRQVVKRAIPFLDSTQLAWSQVARRRAELTSREKQRGPLCTSLTRANRELAVVHARPLPDAL
jgi:hypothetical protein